MIRWRLAVTLFVNSLNINALTRLLLSMCEDRLTLSSAKLAQNIDIAKKF